MLVTSLRSSNFSTFALEDHLCKLLEREIPPSHCLWKALYFNATEGKAGTQNHTKFVIPLIGNGTDSVLSVRTSNQIQQQRDIETKVMKLNKFSTTQDIETEVLQTCYSGTVSIWWHKGHGYTQLAESFSLLHWWSRTSAADQSDNLSVSGWTPAPSGPWLCSHGEVDGRNYASWHSNLRLCALRLMQPQAGWEGEKGHFPSLAASSTIASHLWQLSRINNLPELWASCKASPLPCFSFWRLYKLLGNSRNLQSALHPIHHPWEHDLRKVTGFPGFTHHQQPTKGASGTECITKNRMDDLLTAVLYPLHTQPYQAMCSRSAPQRRNATPQRRRWRGCMTAFCSHCQYKAWKF